MNTKNSATGNPRIDEMLGFGKPTPLVDINAEPDPTNPPEDPDVWESPSGYLRCARQQVFSVILIRKDGIQLIVPYSAIDTGQGKFNGDTFTFTFFKGEAPYEATIIGTITHLQRVFDKLAGGKAELIRANGDEIKEITWEAMPEPEQE